MKNRGKKEKENKLNLGEKKINKNKTKRYQRER